MDPATLVAFTQLVSFSVQTLEKYQAGEITADQAQQMLNAASDHLKAGIDAFNSVKDGG